MQPQLVGSLVLVVATGVAVAAPAVAQTRRMYAGAFVGGYSTDADHVTGSVTNVGGTAGVRVLPWLDVEAEVSRPEGLLTREYTGRSVAFSGPVPPSNSS